MSGTTNLQPTKIRYDVAMPLLPEADLQQFLTDHSSWQVQNGELVRLLHFADFPSAIAFVTEVAPLAELAGHHPDIAIRYNKVRLALTTHDEGGLTTKDISLARNIDRLPGAPPA